jgi:hypothetical protein
VVEQPPVQPPEQSEQPPEQVPQQRGQQPAALTGFGLTMLRPKKAAAVPARALFEESSRNLRLVTFLSFFSMIISFTLSLEKLI